MRKRLSTNRLTFSSLTICAYEGLGRVACPQVVHTTLPFLTIGLFMPGRNSAIPDWSPLEVRLFNTVDIFAHKPAIMEKAQAHLATLKNAIIVELSQAPHPCPPESDIIKGQIVRGENHKGFPFVSLDMPQMFSKTKMFTYRTLFWWGHDLIFSLILKQENLTPVINKLISIREYPEWKDIQLATAPSPWEWQNNPTNFLPVSETSETDIRKTIASIQYVKLCQFYSLSDPTFAELDWADTGLTTWKILSKVCAD